MALLEAFVVIKASLAPLKRGLSLAKAAVSKAMAAIQSSINKMVSISKKALLGLAAVMGIASWAAIKQEKAEYLLAAALKATGEYTDIAFEKFKAFASSIQQVTVYGDEDTLMLMKLMKSLGVTSDKLEEATKMAIGMAAATDRDVKSMAMYIALAIQGETTMLRRYIPALKKCTDKTKELEIITKFAADGFKIARAEAEITSGALTQMKNVIGDVAETIGKPFLDNITKTAKRIKDWSLAHQDAIGKVAESFDRILEISVKVLGKFFAPMIAKLGELAKKFAGFTSESKIKETIIDIAAWADKIWSRIKTLWNLITDLWSGDRFKSALKYGLDKALAQFEVWGKQLKILALGTAKIVGTAFSNNYAKVVSEKFTKLATPKSLFGKAFGITPVGLLARASLYKAASKTADAAGARPTAPGFGELMKKAGRVTPREIAMPSILKDALDKYSSTIDKESNLIDEKWDQLRKEIQLTDKQAKTAEKEAEGIKTATGKTGIPSKVGFVGLTEAWKMMASGLTAKKDPVVIEQKKTTQAINENNRIQKLSLAAMQSVERNIKNVGMVGP